jgi:hypothetical protein
MNDVTETTTIDFIKKELSGKVGFPNNHITIWKEVELLTYTKGATFIQE